MTPNDIEILIHCHVCPEPHPRAKFPAVSETLRSLEVNGLIEQRLGDGYHTTERGKAHIEQLCSTPWPTQVWVNANGGIILNSDKPF